MKIVYFSLIDWDFIYQRPQHLAKRLSLNDEFIYVQPFGLRSLNLSDIPRVFKRLRSFFRFHNPKKNLYIKNPLFIPLQLHFFKKINSFLLKYQINPLIDPQTILWVTYPSNLIIRLLDGLTYQALIYEMMDDYPLVHPAFQKEISNSEEWFIHHASLVIATSDSLAERAKKIKKSPQVKVIKNGVDFEFFTQIPKEIPKEFNITGKIAGYIGSIEKWIDFDLIDFLSKNRPDINFLFIGPRRIKQVPKRKNIFYIGPVDYEWIPTYCQRFDVCLIPFLKSPFSDSINPVKLFEYLALGKPVVSYRMKELEYYQGVVYLAENKEEFLTLIEKALSESDESIAKMRKEIARSNDWGIIAEKIKKEIEALLT